jgi:hypothetical protein
MIHINNFDIFLLENKNEMPKDIRIGNNFKIKYLSSTSSFIAEKVEIEDKYKEYVKEKYEVTNKPNSQLYKGKLYVMKDGSAIMDVRYMTYSGTKNKYKNYFDLDGNEIIHKDDKSRYEREYYEKITNRKDEIR